MDRPLEPLLVERGGTCQQLVEQDAQRVDVAAGIDVQSTLAGLLYQTQHVPEYWIVFPDEHKVLRLQLVDGTYREQEFTDEIATLFPPHAKVDLTKVW